MERNQVHTLPFALAIACMLGLTHEVVYAENIDPTNNGSQYAYGENVGWINLEPLGNGGPGVEVSSSELTGWMWGENIGWVSLSCLNTNSCGTVHYGVTNDGAGNLSGFAWSENVGWINFAPTGSGVIIDPTTGIFGGRAWGENIGWMSFHSPGPVAFSVATSWRGGMPTPNVTPIANAGSDRTVRVGSLVTLDGRGSSDPDNGPGLLSFAWSQTTGPAVVLTGATTAMPTFTPTLMGTYTFHLVVNDSQDSSVPDGVTLTVPQLGDIDVDGDVDSNDLNLIVAARNTPANGPNDLRDLNRDGKIDALDARKLALLCTRPRCATQ